MTGTVEVEGRANFRNLEGACDTATTLIGVELGVPPLVIATTYSPIAAIADPAL